MKIFKYGFGLIAILLFFSCGKKSIHISTSVNLYIVDQAGKNLLNTPSSLNEDNIEVFHVVNGEAKLYYQGNLGASRGYLFFNDESGAKMLRLFLNTGLNNEKYPVTLLKIGDFPTDTIKAEFKIDDSATRLSKVWLNNVLKFDLYGKSGSNTFMIIK